MKEQQINFNLSPSGDEVVIRHGDAEKIVVRESVSVAGTLSVPGEHLSKPPKWLTNTGLSIMGSMDSVLAFSFLKVDRDQGKIVFIEDAGHPWESIYVGLLVHDPRFEKFGINTGKSYTTFELAELFKMNRSFFETRDTAMKLVSLLRNFKAKVDKELEQADDGRGNKKILMAQVVDSNIPPNFRLCIPVFKGYESQALEVEISINANDLSCSLVSPEVNDYIESTKDRLIDAELDAIKELHPTLRIFEV